MINSYLKLIANRPPIQKSSTHTPTNIQNKKNPQLYRKYKLIIILICRITYRRMRQAMSSMSLKIKKKRETLTKISVFSQKNVNLSIYLAFSKIKTVSKDNKKIGNALKSIANLLQRIQYCKLKSCFNSLVLRYTRSNQNSIQKFYLQRGTIFSKKITALFTLKKKQIFDSITAYSRLVKSYNKVRVVSIIHKRFQKHIKQQFFTKVMRFLLSKATPKNVNNQMLNLKDQIQDMNAQLYNKNQNINRLQEQLNQIKIQKANLQAYQNISLAEQNQSKLQKGDKKHIKSRFSSDSLQLVNVQDMSIGSLLGNLSKQRSQSFSKYDANTDCACGYKHRCLKYKALNESLKNQLQIIKEELEVSKDINEHLANEIKRYVTGGEDDYQKVRNQLNIIQEQRDHLREKVFKYQKHIANLKAQFKLKMEELYRKVRKDM